MTEQGRYFYVDSINGDDSCSGFTPEEAWKSLEKVNEMIFQPGDHIRFRRGGEWHGMLRFQGNGSAWSPIAVEAYGEGGMPQIHGDGCYAAVLLEGVSHWRVKELAVTNEAETRSVRQGICICGSPQGIDLEKNHPQIKIEDTPQFYDLSVFNRCAETENVLLTLECWQEVHPGLVTIPVNWDYSIPYGLLYSLHASEEVLRFIEVVKSMM